MEERFVQVADLGDPLRDGTEIEGSRVEIRLELLPPERRRNRRLRERAHGVAGDDLLAVPDHLRVDLGPIEPEGSRHDVREGPFAAARRTYSTRSRFVAPSSGQ
jgi:hypothetical protein